MFLSTCSYPNVPNVPNMTLKFSSTISQDQIVKTDSCIKEANWQPGRSNGRVLTFLSFSKSYLGFLRSLRDNTFSAEHLSAIICTPCGTMKPSMESCFNRSGRILDKIHSKLEEMSDFSSKVLSRT